jgi:hypothetical protein
VADNGVPAGWCRTTCTPFGTRIQKKRWNMKILGKLGAVATVYSFLRSPAGQRIVDEVKRQAADPENRRRVTDLVGRLRPGSAKDAVSPGTSSADTVARARP